MAKPSWHRVDRFSIADVRREYGLTVAETYCFLLLVLLCDHRCGCWAGGLAELAAFTGQGRKTVSAAMRRLAEVGLIEVLEPFTTTEGTVAVVPWDRLVISDEVASATRRQRSRFALSDANDQRKGRVPEVVREEGGIDARVPPTKDWPALGAYRRVVDSFPGAEDVS